MTEHASQDITIGADAAHVLEAVLELDEYPLWIPDIKAVTVFERDERGRAIRAELTSEALGKVIKHIYVYSYDEYPDKITWSLESGNMVTELEGCYTVKQGTPTSTTVAYDLDANLSVSLPGFMKRKAVEKIVSAALANLKTWVERDREAGPTS